MRLVDPDERSLELSIVAYQFPSPTPVAGGAVDWDDANWLVVDGRANDGTREWRFRDACLLTTEAGQLAAWLDAVADGWHTLGETDFVEPNLEFRRVSSPVEPPVVRVTFRLEARPPWAEDTDGEDDWDKIWLEFAVSPTALRDAATDLRTQLERFPERGQRLG